VTVRFLSEEWVSALTERLNASDGFKEAAGTQAAAIQQVISGPDGETRYWTRIADGTIEMGIGDLDGVDATITQSYDTAVALAKRELSPVTGFMMGKIKVAGNMGLLLGLQGILGQIADAMAALDVEY
jgi:putative sterol carrier protein